jgi:hypothetical protein
MVGSRSGGQPRRGKRQGQAAKKRLTHHLFISGESMAAKRTPSKAKRHSSRASVRPFKVASLFAMATNNLINMVAVTTVSSAVLITLLAIKHY